MAKTLTELLRERICDPDPWTEAQSEADEQEVEAVKEVFKDWLKAIGLPPFYQSSEESTRQLIITLVDEPSD